MASSEMELLDSPETVEKVEKMAVGRALNRRNFMAALGLGGAAAGAALVSREGSRGNTPRPRVVEAAGPSQSDILNFALNLEYLEATFYSYLTLGVDLPANLVQGSGTITNPPVKGSFPGVYGNQIVDMLNEIYFDELNHVITLRSLLGAVAVNRPALNLGAFAPVGIYYYLSTARLFEDVGVTAYAGAAPMLTGANLTYAAQILAVEGFHAGALRLVEVQNPASSPFYTDGQGSVYAATTVAGSPVLSAVYYNTTAGALSVAVGQVVYGTGIPANAKIVSIAGTGANTAITGTITSGKSSVTAVSNITGLAIGQTVTAAGVPGGTTITAIGTTSPYTLTLSQNATASTTAVAMTVGTGSITISANALISGSTIPLVIFPDPSDVEPADPGSAVLAAAGPAAQLGFFSTSGIANASALTPAGLAFARTTSQVLQVVYGTPGVLAAPGSAAGGFFPSGMNGLIKTV